ncbi:MAG: hypothetical protein EOP59_09715 [Sphingomonadales bacterium]|nr:MAG: hypothetical protein EOP59_09715 [Sphingomonadales bacterium]
MKWIGEMANGFWRWFTTPPSPDTFWKRAAWGLWLTPPIMLFPFLLPILEPSSFPALLMKFWDIYLLFFGLPFALGAFCWWHADRAAK